MSLQDRQRSRHGTEERRDLTVRVGSVPDPLRQLGRSVSSIRWIAAPASVGESDLGGLI